MIWKKHTTQLRFLIVMVLFAGGAALYQGNLEAENNTGIVFKAVGDIMPGTNFPNNRLPAGKGAPLLKKVQPYLGGADVLFGNFESTLTRFPRTAKNTNRKLVFAFRTPPEFAATFKSAGFDVLSIANNHSGDFFPKGFRDTAVNIRKAGMLPVGQKNVIAYRQVKGKKVAFLGFSHISYHNKVQNVPAAVKLVKKARANADLVVVSFHGGAEGTKHIHVKNKIERFYGENRGNLVKFSHRVVDAGADLVLGHGPHVPRAMELYKGRLIAYSLGNFIGYRAFRTSGYLGYSLVLRIKISDTGEFQSGKIIPLRLSRVGIPAYDRGRSTIKLIKRLTRSDFPRTGLSFSDSGDITVTKRR